MPSIYIDGKKIETELGKTIIEAAYDNGIEIPHFCWHPELSVAGNCRMCLVQVGMPKKLPDGNIELDSDNNPVISYIPKLQIACATQISDGMHVLLNNDKVVTAQESVLEFILINHPLDCPICDEAGECKLQEYAFTKSRGRSRFSEEKVHKPKRDIWGPNVIYDGERCIMCSRCIRYAKEVAKQDILTFTKRGDRVVIKVADGHEFDNPYSMNVIEICPVGALTSRDFRFKARVWEMSFNPSISFADSTGSNTKLGVRNNEILRVQPRYNMYVNRYWLSDDARLNYIDFVNKNRIIEPSIKVDGKHETVSWDNAYAEAAKRLSKYKPSELFFLSSAKATNEDNYAFQKFAKLVAKSSNIDYLEHIDQSCADDFLGVADRTPNSNGATEVGAKAFTGGLKASLLDDYINSGKIKALVVMEEDFSNHEHIIASLDKLDLLIVMYYNHNAITEKADIVLATSTYAEIEGTYTNKNKRVQHFTPALVTKENLRFMGLKMSRLDKFGANNDRWTQHEARNCRQSWRNIQGIAKAMGAAWNYKKSEDVFDEIVEKLPGFSEMDYDKMDKHQGLTLYKANKPDPVLINYVSYKMKEDYKQSYDYSMTY